MKFIEKRAHELYISSSGLSKSADQFGFGYPFLSYTDIFHNYYAPEELLTLVNSTDKDREKCSVERGDVFLTRTSETTDELGMSCVALKTYPNATFNGFAKRLRPITDVIVPEYAAYYFRSSYFRGQCMSMASLITRASLNDAMISRLKIRYPERREDQILIGDILMNYDRLITNNTKRIKLLEQMAENLYKEWFVRFRFPGYERTQFKNGLPKEWKNGRLSDVVDFLGGFAFKSEDFVERGQYRIITIKSVQDDGFDVSKADCIDFVPQRMPKYCHINDGDILISLTGNVGRVCMAYGIGNLLNQRVAKLQTDFPAYVFCLFKTESMLYTLVNLSNGTAQQNLSPIKAARLKMDIPDRKTLEQFEEVAYPFFDEIVKLKYKNENLIKQRDLLLPRLMSGKLEVK